MSGRARATSSAKGQSLEIESRIEGLRLRAGGREVAVADAGRCEGRVEIARDRALSVELRVSGDDLDGAIAVVRAPQREGAIDVAGHLVGEGAWLEALTPLFDLDGVVASGPLALRLALRGDRGDPLRFEGRAEVTAPYLRVAGQELRDVHLDASLGSGRLRVSRARARAGEGELRLTGECGLLAVARRATDRLGLELDAFPIRAVEAGIDGAGGERVTIATITGSTTVVPGAARCLELELDLILDPLTRYLKQRGSIVSSGRLPRLALRGDLSVDGDFERLRSEELRIEGEGASCVLRGVELQRGAGGSGGVVIELVAAPEVARLLLLGYDDPHYGIDGPLRLHLSARGAADAAGLEAEGRIAIDAFTLGGLRGASLSAAFGFGAGRLTFEEARCRLGEGSVVLEPGSFVVVSGARSGACEIVGRLSEVRLARHAGRWLGGVIPLLLVDPQSTPPSVLAGSLGGTVQLRGTGGAGGLSGTASVTLRDGFVRRSILLESLAGKLPQVSDRPLAAAIAEGLGHPLALERALEQAAYAGLELSPCALELRIEQGIITWPPGTTLPTAGMNLGLRGTATPGTGLDVWLSTDLLQRVRNADLAHPPPIDPPPARGALRALEGLELRARMRGNPLARDPDGTLAVHVDVLIAR
jgi:hypothetical protein